jgi:hypothetical protein
VNIMANDEIQNGRPHNDTSVAMGGETLNPAPNESQLNSAMHTQHTDSLVTDGVKDSVHSDSTASTPKGASLIGTEKSVYNGHVSEAQPGTKSGKTVDFHKG